jgi:RHS repeat-associated protein
MVFIVAMVSMVATPLVTAQSSDTTTRADTVAKPDSAAPAASPQGICLTCGPGDNPPTVTITPSTGTLGTASQTVTVDWCDDNSLAATTRQITFNGANVTSQFTYANVTPTSCGQEAKSVGTVTLNLGANTLAAQIKDGAAQLGSASVTYTFTPLVVVTPDSSPLTGYAKIPDTAVFTVKNATASSATYTLSSSCPTGWNCTAPASVALAGNASTNVNLLYSPTTSGTSGTVVLTAAPTTSPSSFDQGSYKVTVPVTAGVSALVIQVLANEQVNNLAGFAVSNSGPTAATFSLTPTCTGAGVSECTVAPNVSVAPRATQLVWISYLAGDSNTAGTVKLAATGSDGGNIASGLMGVTSRAPGVPCDTGKTVQCGPGGDRTPPTIAIRPDTVAQRTRTAAAVVDWCDDDKLGNTRVVGLNGTEVTPSWPDSLGNTASTCNGVGTHSGGTLTLLPGGNAIFAWTCDFVGNCGQSTATYTYDVLDIATADSSFLRRGAGSTFNQAFRVTNIGQETYAFSLTASCSGLAVSACAVVGTTAITLAPGASHVDTVSYQTPSGAAGTTGTVSLVASPVLNPTWSHAGSINVFTVTPVVAVAATPDSVSVPIADSLVNTYDFWARDAGNVRESLTLSLTCTGVTACSASPTTVTVAPNDSARIRATFTAGGPGTSGSVQLSATSGAITDHGIIFTHAQPKDLPVASLDSAWAPARIERALCVTIAVGTGGTADECGDLRVAVATSTTHTLGEARTPSLLYGSSDATARVVLPIWVSLLPQATLPDSITAALLIGGVVRDHGGWVKAQWAAGAGRQIALAIDGRTLTGGPGGANDHSGEYAATVQVTAYDGAKTLVDTLTTTIPVVDRSQSAFGAGWWLAGLERIYFASDGTLTWVGGDGSLRTYTKDPAHTSIYRATSLTRLDSLVKDASGEYIRYLPDRLHVRFNSAGQHIATINRLGDSTVFAYNASGQVQTITIAPVTAAKTYTFSYDASGRLAHIAAPLGGANGTTARVTTLAPVGTTRQVASVTLADGSLIQFTYDTAVGRVLTSTDPRGTKTTFAYDAAGKLLRATIGMKGQVPDLVTTITTSASQGIRGTAAVDTAVVATRIDGPRTDVGDTTVIRVTPFDAPRRITDALGHVTRLDHSKTTFPALVTHEHRLDAAASIASYDAKGHLISETDSTTYVDDALGTRTYATTAYQWDNVWDEVTLIAPPLHDSTVITYDPANGNRLTQRDVVGDTVHYGYNSSGRLVSVRDTTHALPDSLTYDALGNVASTISPLGFVSRSLRDAIGRDTLVTTPLDSAQTQVAGSRTVYDLADRPTLTQSFGPAVTFTLPNRQTGTTFAETLSVATVYDSGGLVRRVTRTANPDTTGVHALLTRMGYDPAGRKVADTATDGAADTYRYDAAGHVIEHDTRDHLEVTWQYDALGELASRQMSGRTPGSILVDTIFVQWVPSDFALSTDDHSTFTYDSAGRLRTADNETAEIRRTYAPNGALLSDSLLIDTWAYDGNYSRHDFLLTHTYDLDGRRVTTRGVGGDSVAYDLAGRVTGIQDDGRRWFLYRYDKLSRPDTVLDPNGARLMRTYDAEDRVTRRLELDPAGVTLHDDTLAYDARGKVLHSGGLTEVDYEGYSALGTLWASMRESRHFGAMIQNDERFVADAMGNVLWRTVQRNNSGAFSHDSIANTYGAGTGRLLAPVGILTRGVIAYTAAGEREVTTDLTGLESAAVARYYYRADGMLVAVDNRSCTSGHCKPAGLFTPTLTGAFEDYRYDALGRRVLVRTRMDSICTGPTCLGSIMWVVFDGDQIAAEIRGAGRDGLSADSLEAGHGSGPFYGTVDYLNGPTLDEPLEIQGIQVYRTWRGLIDGGDCLTGTCGTGAIDFPGVTYEAYLSVVPATQSAPASWHGSLFAEGQDDGGLMYRRNRYYDPGTGQFTQEDPIGLAGGTNSYGFGGADPINDTDPFGTDCPPGKAVALCVILSVIHSLSPGKPPFLRPGPVVERSGGGTTPPQEPLEAPEFKEFPREALKSYKELVKDPQEGFGGGGDEPDFTVLRKILSAGGSEEAGAAARGVGGKVLAGGLSIVIYLLRPPALGGKTNACKVDPKSKYCSSQ